MTIPQVQQSSGLRRFAERFALIAFGLYHVPLFLNNYPSLGGGGFNSDGLAIKWGHVFTAPGIWVARHIFNITGPMNGADSGDNGDVAEEFGRLFLAVVFGIVIAIVWALKDNRSAAPSDGVENNARATALSETVRVLLRYSIALGITSYGIAKILPMQFPPIPTFTLEQRVGELAPMSLLWTFMEYSRPYAFIAGAMEMIAVFLLCVRQTATLGAIVCLVVMANVAIMNLAYGVPVKLYAIMIVVSSVVLLLYDAPRLLGVFVQNRTVTAATIPSIFHERLSFKWRWAIKVVMVGSVVISSWTAMSSAISSRGNAFALDGAWVVTSFARDSATAPDSLNWRKVIVQQNTVLVELGTGARMFCRNAPSADSASLALSCANKRTGDLHFARDSNIVQINGTFDGARIVLSAVHRGEADYPLLRSRFRWMQQ